MKKGPGLFNGWWYEEDENGELQPTKERIPFKEWPEIYRLYRLGVQLGLQSEPQQPTEQVS